LVPAGSQGGGSVARLTTNGVLLILSRLARLPPSFLLHVLEGRFLSTDYLRSDEPLSVHASSPYRVDKLTRCRKVDLAPQLDHDEAELGDGHGEVAKLLLKCVTLRVVHG
jgi:hypothetical protein